MDPVYANGNCDQKDYGSCDVDELMVPACDAIALYAFWPLVRVCIVEQLLTTYDLTYYA